MEEMTLRSAIEVLLRHKKKIILLPLCLIVASLLAVNLTDKQVTYKAEAVVSEYDDFYSIQSNSSSTNIYLDKGGAEGLDISKLDPALMRDNDAFINTIMNFPRPTLEACKANLVSENSIKEIYGKLTNKKSIGTGQIKNEINLKVEKNIYTIEVSDTEPERAAQIANAAVTVFRKYIDDYNETKVSELRKSLDSLILQKEKEITDLSEAVKAAKVGNAAKAATLQLQLDVNNRLYEGLLVKRDQVNSMGLVSFRGLYTTVMQDARVLPGKALPDYKQIAVLAGAIGLFFGVVLAFFIEYWRKTSTNEN